MAYSHAISSEESITVQDEPQPHVGDSCGVIWMILFQIFCIFCYVFAIDTRDRHYVEMANKTLPALNFVACVAIVYWRVSRSHLLFWAPLTWFFVIVALTYGMAPMIYYYGDEYAVRELEGYFVLDDVRLMRTNFLNTVGVLIVLVAHAGTTLVNWHPAGLRMARGHQLRLAKRIFWTILIVALPAKWFIFIPMYMEAFSFIVPAWIQNIGNLMGTCIVLGFFIGMSAEKKYLMLAVFLMVADMGASLLIFSKSYFILPVMQATLGAYLARRKLWHLFAGLLVIVAAYMWVKPLVDNGRARFYHRGSPEFEARVEMIYRYVIGEFEITETYRETHSEHWWSRQSFSTIEGYMMNSYDNGSPGDSIKDFWVVFIPRMFWPDKPIISNAGAKLNKLITGSELTAIGGTIFGEAYWNGGWLMVGLVALYAGIALNIFGRYSLHYMEAMDLRFLPIALLGIHYGLSVQDWFVLAYVGIIPIIVVLWFGLKMFLHVETE